MSKLFDWLRTETGIEVTVKGWKKPPLSLNDRLHFHVEAKKKREVRELGAEVGQLFGGPANRVSVRMLWHVSTRHRRDDENPVATLKPFCDGLVDGGLVRDDTNEFMVKIMPEIVYSGFDSVVFVIDILEACSND